MHGEKISEHRLGGVISQPSTVSATGTEEKKLAPSGQETGGTGNQARAQKDAASGSKMTP